MSSFHARFLELYDAHYDRLFRYLDRLSGDAELAADLAQDAFVRLYARGASPDQPAAWLVTVAMNLLRNVRTTQTRRRRLLGVARAEGTLADPAPAPNDAVEAVDVQRRVRAALAQLSERDRHLLLLRSEGYRYQEIAAALELNPASVGVLVARAKHAFRAAYEEPRDRGEPTDAR